MNISTIILAAGKGSRMLSNMPKVLHKIASKPLIGHIINTLKSLDIKHKVIVIGPDMLQVQEYVRVEDGAIRVAIQEERLGTADAVKIGLTSIEDKNDILVLYGDTPFVKADTMERMYDTLQSDKKNALVILGFTPDNPATYGRLVVSGDNDVDEIAEFCDCTPEQKKINLCNSGIMLLKRTYLEKLLAQIKSDNAKNEFYLTDMVKIARQNNLNCKYLSIDPLEAIAINSQTELAEAEKVIQNKLRNQFLEQGVSMMDPSTVYFALDTTVEPGVTIQPFVLFGLGVVIKSGSVVKSFSHLEGVTIGNRAAIGPFARIRSGTIINDEVKIGNFVELKNSTINSGTKISHLSYIGDATIGRNVNIGAGTITCNYDGFNKYMTTISDNVFIGSNTAFIAPVNVEEGAIIAAGSVITNNVDSNSIAIARALQENLQGKAESFRQKKLSELAAKPNL